MKLICDCGTEVNFKENSEPNSEGIISASQDYSKMTIVGEHDEVWVTCKNCKKSIHFFT